MDDLVQPLHEATAHVGRPLPDVAPDHDAARAVLDGLLRELQDGVGLARAGPPRITSGSRSSADQDAISSGPG